MTRQSLREIIQDELLIMRKWKWFGPTVIAYWYVRYKLAVVGDIIVKGEQVLIPKLLRKEILKPLHTTHLGMEKTMQYARQVVF